MRKIQLVALALVLLQACAPDTITGTGPVTLTSSQQQHFDKHRQGTSAKDPLYFFLIKGGRSYSVYCPETAAICRDDHETNWHSKCEKKYGTGSCKLYGMYGQVTWKKDQPADPNWYNLYPETPENVGGKGLQADCPDGSIDNGKGQCLVHRKEANPADGKSPITDRLEALKKLEDAGLISKEEAAAKRKEILKNL